MRLDLGGALRGALCPPRRHVLMTPLRAPRAPAVQAERTERPSAQPSGCSCRPPSGGQHHPHSARVEMVAYQAKAAVVREVGGTSMVGQRRAGTAQAAVCDHSVCPGLPLGVPPTP